MAWGKQLHIISILFQQVDIRIRTNYFGPVRIKRNPPHAGVSLPQVALAGPQAAGNDGCRLLRYRSGTACRICEGKGRGKYIHRFIVGFAIVISITIQAG